MPSQIEVQGTTKIGFQTKAQFFEKRNLQGQSPFRKSGVPSFTGSDPMPLRDGYGETIQRKRSSPTDKST